MSSATNATSSASASFASSGAEDAEKTIMTPTDETSSSDGGTCTWYEHGMCNSPRSCYDCLRTPAGSNCAINTQRGDCGEMNPMDVESFTGPEVGFYPAANYSYCPHDDAICGSCIVEWRSEYSSTGKISSEPFCTGADGCICLAACEIPSRDDNIIQNRCSFFQMNMDAGEMARAIALTVAMFATVLFTVLCFRRWKRRQGPELIMSSPRPQRQRVARPPPSGPQLNLTGWTSMREKIEERQRVQLSGVGAPAAVSIMTTVPMDVVDTDRVGGTVAEGAYHPAPSTPQSSTTSQSQPSSQV